MSGSDKMVTRKFKWTINNASETRIKQHHVNNPIISSKFKIVFEGISHELRLISNYKDGFIEFYLKLYHLESYKNLSITCKACVGGRSMKSWTINANTLHNADNNLYGWSSFVEWTYPGLLDLAKNGSLVFDVEIILKKLVQQPEPKFPAVVRENYEEFMYDDDYSDASFTCSDNVKFEVHRVLLIKRSLEFKKIFREMKQQNQRNRRFTYDSVTMTEILNFVYTGNADLKDIQLVKKIYSAAITFDLAELQLQCIDSLSNQISIETVLDIFEIADELLLDELSEKCLTYIMKFFHQLKATPKWRNLDADLKEMVTSAFADNYSVIELVTNL